MGRPRLMDLEAGAAVDWLFLDLNSYFASVEQQERPELRDRPMAVVPLDTPNTVCIAASYEAKALGIKTGTKVKEARRICPDIVLVEGRPKIYTEYHNAILEAVERCLPVTTVMSIDEAACRLVGRERYLPNALTIAAAVKEALRTVGDTLRCSIGLAPNRYLAKVASDMQKPDGLTVLLKEDLPQSLFRLQPGDLPGVGPNTKRRLETRGITSMERLCALTEDGMRSLWGGITGERLWHWLRGADFDVETSERKSLGRQHVLAPQYRTRDKAFHVAQKLLHHAAAELRRMGWWTCGIGVAVQFLDDKRRGLGPWVTKPSWQAENRIDASRDYFTLRGHLKELWRSCPERAPILVYVRLFRLVPDTRQSLSLFSESAAKQERATAAMDSLNRRFGAQLVYPGGLHEAREAAPRRISFRHVPTLEEF